ncbi:MAG: alpha/beta hydrolase family esterase [Myxococcota bacterium]
MLRNTVACTGLLSLLLSLGCGDGSISPGSGAQGGSAPTGGASSGGASSGGASSGGASSGGVTASSGGATSSNGGVSTGGAATSSGGVSSGGASSGGASSGGRTGSGGTSASGGAGTTGGTSSAGAGGASSSSGCGKTSFPPGDGSTLQTIDVNGTARQYILALPSGYDPNKPYRVIFAWHGRTGTAAQIAGGGNRAFYGLKSLLADSIFVAGQGLGTASDPADTGWPNTDGRDIAMVKALVAHLSSNYCVDQNRLMSTGFSYGGIMSNTIGCQMSDVFRAIAPIAGAYFGGRGTACNAHPIAYLGIHGMADNDVTYANGEAARDLFVKSAHCATTTQPIEPSGCVAYDGCDSGYPVNWCSHSGAHTIPSSTGQTIATFFKQF